MGMGKRRRRRRCTVGLDWIFNPMGMGKKRCANLFNPMVMGMGMGKKRRKKRCGLLPLLPEDVLISILLCLPVTSLLRFKSVCKSWRELMDTSFFIDLHTTTTTTSSSSSSKFGDTFILQTSEYSRGKYEDDIKLYMLSSSESGDDHGDGEDNEDDDVDQKKRKKMVFKVDEDLGFSTIYKDNELDDTLRMVGSCNGIICLHDPELMDITKGCKKQHYSNLRDIYLWNPATRQFRILPKSIPIKDRKEDFIGFGFDIKTKDYKVLRITPLWDYGSKVQVYSLSTDSWRLLEGINFLPVQLVPNQSMFLDSRIYLNGSSFFVVTKPDTDEMTLVSFDFTKEIFTTMQLPENDSRYSNLVLSSLGRKMVVFTRPLSYEYYDIWVLNEQHCSGSVVVNKESWTKLHSLRIKTKRGRFYYGSEPRCISNNGEFALISTGQKNKLQLFNLVTKEAIKDFTISTKKECRAEVYKESLVSIMGGGNVLLRWQLPTHGTCYRLNLDAPFIKDYHYFGIGLCLTSDTGGCIGVRSLQRSAIDAEEGEALAMLEAIKWAKKLELSPIIIESDSKKVVSFFMDDDDDDDDDDNNSTYWSSEALSLLREAKLLLNSSELGIISLKYFSRSCNYVADIAAKLGREHFGFWNCKDWSSANFSGEMVRSLSKDLGSQKNETWYKSRSNANF